MSAHKGAQSVPQMSNTLYFIRAGEFVKVGRTSKLIDRINELRTGCPFEFGEIIAFFGFGHEERSIHRRLARHRSSGEWFRWSDDVEREIVGLAQRAGIAVEHLGLTSVTELR